jgi:hypothetical protein
MPLRFRMFAIVPRHLMTEVREGSLYPEVAPIAVFLCHSYDQIFDLLPGPGPAGRPRRPLPSYLPAMPG